MAFWRKAKSIQVGLHVDFDVLNQFLDYCAIITKLPEYQKYTTLSWCKHIFELSEWQLRIENRWVLTEERRFLVYSFENTLRTKLKLRCV